jgi:hypothetical protein
MKPLDHLKRTLAYGLIASVLLGAGLGIAAVLRNQWSWFEVRVLLTTALLAAACICGLVSDLSRTPRGLNLLPFAGLCLTLITTVLLLYLVWWHLSGPGPSEVFVQIVCCLSIFTVATVHMSLLSVARLAPRFQWTLWAAWCIIFALASLLSAQVLREFHGPVDDMLRPIAVLSILAIAITLVIPLLHRISQTDPNFTPLSLHEEQNSAAVDAEIEKLQRRLSHLQLLRSKLPAKA